MLITDHNVRETLRITDRAYIVHDGVIFKSGTPDEPGGRRGSPADLSGDRVPVGLRSRSRRTCDGALLTGAMAISAETSHQARSEADSDAVAAAGDQAAADVDARAVGPPQPGDGREPDARGSADRGAAAGRSRRRRRKRPTPSSRPNKTDTWDDQDYEYFFGDYLDDGYRPRAPQEVKELPPIENTLSTASSLADHLMWQLSMQTDDAADARDRRGHHRQPRRRRLSRRVVRRARGDGRRGRSPTSSARCSWSRASIRSASPRATCRSACCCSCGTSVSKARRPRRSSPSTCGCCRTTRCPEIARKLGHDDRRSQGAHRDHPAPRSEAGQPLQPDAVAVRHPRRLRREGRGPVRRGAERRRAAADAHQPGLPPAARQERGGEHRRDARLREGQVPLGAVADQVGRAAAEDDPQGRQRASSTSSATSSITASSTCGRWCCATSPTTSACTSRRSAAS